MKLSWSCSNYTLILVDIHKLLLISEYKFSWRASTAALTPDVAQLPLAGGASLNQFHQLKLLEKVRAQQLGRAGFGMGGGQQKPRRRGKTWWSLEPWRWRMSGTPGRLWLTWADRWRTPQARLLRPHERHLAEPRRSLPALLISGEKQEALPGSSDAGGSTMTRSRVPPCKLDTFALLS